MDLFDAQLTQQLEHEAPLADRMRPHNLDDYVGQSHLIAAGKPLRVLIERDRVPSMILWGPPGTGKTTLARIIANLTKSHFVPFSAVNGSVKQIREVVAEATERRKFKQRRTLLFVDEIHRFNKGQQDAFLPYVENGTITLIGATTENPSFEVNNALLSRCRVFVLQKIQPEEMAALLERALKDKVHGFGSEDVKINKKTLGFLAAAADGDARTALNTLELAINSAPKSKAGKIVVNQEMMEESLQRSFLLYDKNGEEHYNIISALHKSVRGGDANAAIYWLGRMLEAGEDPLYVARRLIRMASEDIGMADPQALPLTVSGYQAAHMIGMPECAVVLAEVVVYLARAPKSVEVYKAYGKVREDIRNLPNEPVPHHIRNAPTKLMKDLGYGKGYKYTPDFKDPEDAKQEYLPEKLKDRKYLSS